ncbi:PRP38-domain-containing protein [Russula earlei]|uniref:PRP38-domain-containing protein n=1 Tax=Russula earlei TaxID=71964 RepID=A0ACC0UCQ8_9AGAM|nr:PRP38-domain-containing protein [Russula earlei]
MANTTVRGAQAIHGQNPQFLVETVIRNRIYESQYWKEHCFALTAESLIDLSIKLRAVGGLLQIQPEKEILIEYLQADEFKYLRALAAIYIRMTFRAVEVYEILEPLLKDYRKLRYRDQTGYYLTYIDEFVDQLLNDERVCDIILPRIPKRAILEENGELAPRQSILLDAMEGKDEEGSRRGRSRSGSRNSSPSSRSGQNGMSDRGRSPSWAPSTGHGGKNGSRPESRSPSPTRSGSPVGSDGRFRSHSRSISPDRV